MGHIFFISPSSPGGLDKLSQWTLRWLLENEMAEDSTMYTCNTIEEASNILETALIVGESPALIIFDHADRPTEENIAFSKRLHNSIPESWVIELVPNSMPIQREEHGLYWIRSPLTEEEWRETLDQVLRKTPTPQWADSDN